MGYSECSHGVLSTRTTGRRYAAMFTQLGRDADERVDSDEEEWSDFGAPLELVKRVDGSPAATLGALGVLAPWGTLSTHMGCSEYSHGVL